MFQTDGRTVERTDGRRVGRSNGRTDGRTVERTGGRTDGRSDRTCLNSRRMSRERQTQNQRERHGHGEWQALDQRQRKRPRHTHTQTGMPNMQTSRQSGERSSGRVIERSTRAINQFAGNEVCSHTCSFTRRAPKHAFNVCSCCSCDYLACAQ